METVTVSSVGEHNISEVGFVTMLFFAHAPSHALLEWVTVEADIKHSAASDLSISLTSPSGTTSVFATPRTKKASGFKLTVNRSPSENIATILANPANEAADMVKVEEWSNVIFFSLLQECCTTKCEFSIQRRQPGKLYVLLMDSMSYCFFDDQIQFVNYVTRKKNAPDLIFLSHNYPRLSSPSNRPVFSFFDEDFRIFENQLLAGETTMIRFSGRYDKPPVHFDNWKFSSTQFWMEQTVGVWEFFVQDTFMYDSGSINNVRLKFYTVEVVTGEEAAAAAPELEVDSEEIADTNRH
jgi:subtilisin-like proprotein convertase family protein